MGAPKEKPFSDQSEKIVISQVFNPRGEILRVAENLVGRLAVQYSAPEFGLSPEDGFDCSGFVKFVLASAGIEIPENFRHADEFFYFFGVPVHESLVQPADLVFFSYRGIYPDHMGIVFDNDHYIHAHSGDGKVKKKRLHLNKPIPHPDERLAIYSYNPIGFKRIRLRQERWQLPI